jgi:hypothetical protein
LIHNSKTNTIMKSFLSLLVLSSVFLSCEKNKMQELQFKGPEINLYHGKAWSWIKLGSDGAPKQLAVAMNDAAVLSMPTMKQTGEGHHHANSIVLPLHPKAASETPFTFIGLDWNPSGHEGPGGVYETPHFDFHFYMIPEAEMQVAVDPGKLDLNPEAAYVPQNYVAGPAVPQMGKHWIDITSAELNGQPFTETFIYGSYNGNINFYEPMITLDFMKNTPLYERAIPQPLKVNKSAYYPTKMRISRLNGVTNVILDEFVYRTAS